jgi:hypothetical protein
MKKELLLSLFILSFITAKSQTISLIPTDDAYVWSVSPDLQNGTLNELSAARWSWGGNKGTIRSYMKFDLSTIPANARIISATLVLKAPAITSAVIGGHQGQNDWRIENVASSWDETTISWNNQPGTGSLRSYYLPATTSANQSYALDITTQAMEWLSNHSANHGIMFRLQNEAMMHTSLVFASKEAADSSLHPKLEIDYFVPAPNESSILMRLNNTNSEDSYLWSVDPLSNNGNNSEIGTANWTWSGKPGTISSLLKFDLKQLPENAEIKRAYLRLYGNYPTSSAVQNGHSGNNDWKIQRITSDWKENEVNWDLTPTSTDTNEIVFEKCLMKNQDFCIDIKTVLQDIFAAGNNYGLKIDLVNNDGFQSVIFGSSENSDTSLRPFVEIYYTQNASSLFSGPSLITPTLYPNPSRGICTVSSGDFEFVVVYDASGKMVYTTTIEGKKLDISHLANGLYTVVLSNKDGNSRKEKISLTH